MDYWGLDNSSNNNWGTAIWEGIKSFGKGLGQTVGANATVIILGPVGIAPCWRIYV